MASSLGATKTLAQFVVAARSSDLPRAIRDEAKRSITNGFGCALAGVRESAVQSVVAATLPFAGHTQATLVARRERMDALNAAFVNAVAMNIHDFDDTHLRTVIHPTAPIASALFALAETRPVSGAELLHAFALGVEVACRVGNAVSPGHYSHGWHITSTCGIFGAAAATGKLLGLDAERMAWALGIAATQAGGLTESLGSMAKSVNVGNAAKLGMYSALLAERGLTGSTRVIETTRGFLECFGGDLDPSALTTRLGETWELASNTYKPYPSGVVFHPIIDACLALREREGVRADSIRSIVIRGHPLVMQRGDRPHPTDGLSGKLSVYYCAAVAIVRGAAGLREFLDANVNLPDTQALQDRVSVIDDPAIDKAASHVTATLADGRTHVVQVEHARGSLGRPLTQAELLAKFRECADYGRTSVAIEPLLAALDRLDEAPDAASLLALTVPRSS